jgi:hypothetical protein
MNKVVMLLLSFVFALQLPFCPREYIPREWIRNYEFGKQWTRLLIRLYQVSHNAGKAEEQQKPAPLTQIKAHHSIVVFTPTSVQYPEIKLNNIEMMLPVTQLHLAEEVVKIHFDHANLSLQIAEKEEQCESTSAARRPETHS